MLSKVTMILRGYNYEEVRNVASILKNSKYVRNMEVTLNTENAYEIIRKISDEYGKVLNIGAGTVLTYEELVKAHESGATFVLSPYRMTDDMLNYCKTHNIYSVPGGLTPSEVNEALTKGADAVKIFPANEFSHSYAKKLIEPMGEMSLMAVGGVNYKNIKEILNSGYKYVGSAGGIFEKNDLKEMNVEAMKRSLKRLEEAIERE